MLPHYSQHSLYHSIARFITQEEREGIDFPDLDNWGGSCFGFSLLQLHYLMSGRQDDFSTLLYNVTNLSQLSVERQKQTQKNALQMIAIIEKIQEMQYSKKLPTLLKHLLGEDAPACTPKSAFVGRVQDLEKILTVFFEECNSLLLGAHNHAVSIMQVEAVGGEKQFVLMGPNDYLTALDQGAKYHAPIGLKTLCQSLVKENFLHAQDDCWDFQLNTLDKQESPPLLKALEKFHFPKANLRTKSKVSSLSAACISGLRGHVECFLKTQKEHCNQQRLGGYSPLYLACQNGHLDVVQLIFENGANYAPDENGATPLFAASQQGHIEVVRFLLDHGATHNPKKNGTTPLSIASQNGHHEVVQLLLDYGANHNPSADEATPLFFASQNGHLEAVRALLNSKSVTHAPSFGTTPLSIASQNGRWEVVRLLLEYEANHNPDNSGRTPLLIASQYGRWEVVRLLLENRANHNPDKNDTTPLFMACQEGYSDIVRSLLRHGATHHPRKDAATPLFVASQQGYPEIVKALLEHEANHNPNQNGTTPLFIASQEGHPKIVRILLKHRANHNPNNNGVTPLFMASQEGDIEVVRLLLRYGANHNPRKDGTTPIEIAQGCGHSSIVALLKEHKQQQRHDSLTPAYRQARKLKRSRASPETAPELPSSSRRKSMSSPDPSISPKK